METSAICTQEDEINEMMVFLTVCGYYYSFPRQVILFFNVCGLTDTTSYSKQTYCRVSQGIRFVVMYSLEYC